MNAEKDRISPAEFVRVWQESSSLDEVTEKTGMTRVGATVRASSYRRKHDVRLKKFPRKSRVDWLDVQRAAHKYRKPEGK